MKNEKINEISMLVAVFFVTMPLFTKPVIIIRHKEFIIKKRKKGNLKNVYWLFKNEL